MKLGLSNIINLLEHTGIDHEKLRTVHIAGTNGKGSVANIIAQVLIANGHRTGLFTSPHLQRFNERIKINNIEITDEKLSEYINFFKEGIEKFNCTFFEANTAIALKYFIDSKADIAVIETGLGGRLDSTNILTPLVSVITGIDFDHQKQLGTSIVQIAGEKAGIIKPGIPVVLSLRRKSAEKTISRTAKRNWAKLIIPDRKKYKYTETREGLSLDFNFGGKELSSEIKLKGRYQRDNIITALTALKTISRTLSLDPEKTASALSGIKVRGRMEVISDDPYTVIDAAHNAEGLLMLKSELEKQASGTVHLIFGTVKDKDYEKIIKLVSSFKAKKYYSQADNKRALDIETIKNSKYASGDRNAEFCETPLKAYEQAVKNYRKGDVIAVSGSHFLIGDLLNSLKYE